MASGATTLTALTSGALAAFNPCGFAMLPAYLASFVGGTSAEPRSLPVRLLQAARVGAAVSAGFVVVFGVIGIVLEPFTGSINSAAPWITSVIGVLLVIMGVAMLLGNQLKVNVPRLQFDASKKNTKSMFLYGVSYAVVSLGCTLPVFAIQVASGLRRDGIVSGLLRYVAYAGGMGLVVVSLTVAVAFAQQGFVRGMRKVLPYVNKISAVLLIIAGLYFAYYGWFSRELTTKGADAKGGGLFDWVEARSSTAQNWLLDRSSYLLIGLVLLTSLIATAYVLGPRRKATSTPAYQTDLTTEGNHP
jgi:cytochrome c-type biogenesis protein